MSAAGSAPTWGLLTQAHWDQATIGAVLTASGLIGIALHARVGALIDVTRIKRGLLVEGVAALAVSAPAIAWAPTLPVVLAADIVMSVLGAVFTPTWPPSRSGDLNSEPLGIIAIGRHPRQGSR